MEFRTLVKQGWLFRLTDMVGHILFGFILGSVAVQFIPDMFLPIIWLRSWRSGKLLPENDRILLVHKNMHTIWPVLWLLLWAALLWNKIFLWLAVQYFVHIAWDQVTHPESVFKKNLWGWNYEDSSLI